ncbi:hypothetical protein IC757_04030 [Wenzhouxiangella sp. AB-CW3]|uniref:hypothetical protein n=1 Tax=Wenzhouxiangella sp. AB-CW3 TaxID=2771012 RepID=UPI00168A716B|nr:hypothetical protein [Wenzhouxiangella sp. AB-CW3]QOC23325.1 hypothetical protein IC757_04030 [Wenzhouxiangella sp. AB-CW3]
MFQRIALIWVLIASMGTAVAQTGETEGVVEQVQLFDASAMTDETFLVLSLTDERHFELPGASQLPAGSGVEVVIDYLEPATDDDSAMPQACRVRVLAVPIMVEGEEVMQRARRPFEIYRNPEPDCE